MKASASRMIFPMDIRIQPELKLELESQRLESRWNPTWIWDECGMSGMVPTNFLWKIRLPCLAHEEIMIWAEMRGHRWTATNASKMRSALEKGSRIRSVLLACISLSNKPVDRSNSLSSEQLVSSWWPWRRKSALKHAGPSPCDVHYT